MFFLRIYACVGLLALEVPSFGQSGPLFAPLGKEHLPALGPSLRAHALGDVDGDRDLDLVVDTNDRFVLLLNDGAARFGEAPAGARLFFHRTHQAWTPFLAIPSQGSAAVDLVLPQDPALVGIDLHCQAFLVDLYAPSASRFTNLVVDRVTAH